MDVINDVYFQLLYMKVIHNFCEEVNY